MQALGQQQKALELAGQRAVLGVGQGDRQSALNGQLNSQQDRFSQQSLDLENQRSDPSRKMSDEEFTRKSQALADANKKATDQIRQNYADVAKLTTASSMELKALPNKDLVWPATSCAESR